MTTAAAREYANVRLTPGGRIARTRVRLLVSERRRGVFEAAFDTATTAPAELDEFAAEARAVRACLAPNLPAGLADNVVVECGKVLTVVTRQHQDDECRDERYAIAIARGTVLLTGTPRSVTRWGINWAGCGTWEPDYRDLPVILGPSASLTLILHVLDTWCEKDTETAAKFPCLTIMDTAASPYPPHSVPHDLFDKSAGPVGRCLAEAGECHVTQLTGKIDPAFLFLTRGHRALSCLGPSSHVCQRNLSISYHHSTPPPARSVTIDSWSMQSSPHDGELIFEAACSVSVGTGDQVAVFTTLQLRGDPLLLLSRVQSACGPGAPALDCDPIDGERFGWAPPLALDLAMGTLMPT